MNIEALLQRSAAQRVKLSVKDGKLVCQLPEGGVNDDLLGELKQHKEEVVQFILDARKNKLARVPIKKQPGTVVALPLSHAQQRLWVLDQIEGSAHYNLLNVLILKGDLQFELFRLAFDTIVARHEVLRTVYQLNEQGRVCQLVQPFRPLEINRHDLRGLSSEERDIQLHRLQLEENRRPFKLDSDLMIRVTLVQVEDNEYVLMVNIHHIATDGWSIGLLVKEFNTLYTAYYNRQPHTLAGLNIQYSDYACWQQETLIGERLNDLKNYWLNQLADLPPVHSLPLDFIRPAAQTFAGETLVTQIGLDELNGLKQLCDREGTTLFAGLYTVFTILLARYSNENDIVVGTPVANRQQPEIEQLIGFFVNMLVLRTRVPGETGFVEMLRQTRGLLFDAFAHQQMPFDMLVAALQPERNAAYSPLFQVMFALQNNEQAAVELPGLTLLPAHRPKPFAMYDLSLQVFEQEQGLSLSWEFNTDIFTTATIKKLSGHFEKLLVALVQSPGTDVRRIGFMTDEETRQVVFGFNQTAVPHPVFRSVVQQFEAQVQKTPNAVAVVFEHTTYTYSELNIKANRLARHLLSLTEHKPAGRIGVMLNRSAESVLAMVAIMKTGACYVPIDYQLPADTVKHILNDTGIQLVLTTRGVWDNTANGCLQMVYLDGLDINNYDAGNPEVPVRGEHESYIIYTSGSTGTPKGVIQTHLMLSNLVQWNIERSGVDAGLKLLQYASFYFDVSLQDCWFTLCGGGELHVTASEIRTDFRSLLRYIISNKVAVLVFPFSAMNVFFLSNQLADYEGHAIKHIVASGEQLVVNTPLQEFLEHNPEVKLHNHYGPSETHVVTSYTLQAATGPVISYLPIGKPVDNTALYILDQYLQPVPVGVKGEVYIEGHNLATGYLNLPQLTEQRFITSPFNEGKKMYKTGDIAYWLPDGNILYTNRNDNQLKIRGYRIEPRQVEKALEQLPQVKNAIVTLFERHAEKSLCAYLVMDSDLDVQAIRTFLYSRLPDYMMPAYFVKIDRIPITANGKMNKKALPDPHEFGLRTGNGYEAPATETETALAAIWEEVLNRKEIGATENFFDLGGDSIKAIGLLHRVQQKFSLQVKVMDFFNRPTIRLLAEEIQTAGLLRKQQPKKETKTLKI